MSNELILLVPIFFAVSMLYSAAGFGGGSSYLAILSLFSFDFLSIRMLALLCNIVVVSTSVALFWRNDFIKLKKIIPLIGLSIPMAFIGGRIQIRPEIFFVFLGFSLLFASIFMLLKDANYKPKNISRNYNAVIGGAIGFLSGVVGIGGGIFLAPVLHISKWDKTKVIAATTASFILVNSIAGLLGQLSIHGLHINVNSTLTLLCAVFLGGQVGSRITIHRLQANMVMRITAFLIMFVACRILLKQFGLI